MSYINNTRYIPKFGGNLFYVNKGNGDNSNSGTSPDKAFETIGAGIDACSEGDAITIKAGTYTELDLDLDVNSVEFWFESGAIIEPAAQATPALIISGDSCVMKGPHIIKGTNLTGTKICLQVTGIQAHISDGKVLSGGKRYSSYWFGCHV